MIFCWYFLNRKEILVCMYLSQHHIFVIFIKLILFCSLCSISILHVLESLSLEKDINLVLFDLHDVRTLAIDQNNPVA